MPQTPIVEGNHAGAYIVDEPSRTMSRETVTITGGDYSAGQVLGQLSNSKYTEYDGGAGDGRQTAVAILFDNTDASSADVEAVAHLRLMAANGGELVWKSDISSADKTSGIASLKTKNIIVV